MRFKQKKVGKAAKCHFCKVSFKPYNPRQHFCTEQCAWKYWHSLSSKQRNKALAREIAAGFGFRSLAELAFQVRMDEQGIPRDALYYEIDKFKWQPKIKTYTPDWKVITPKGDSFYIEFKGKLDRATRTILVGVRRCNPDLDLRLVFEKPNNRINAGSKTTYWQWAEKHGFLWSSLKEGVPAEWLLEE